MDCITTQWTNVPRRIYRHNIPVIINNNMVKLPPLAEEYATMFAKFIDTLLYDESIF
jgi:hypothetical protein